MNNSASTPLGTEDDFDAALRFALEREDEYGMGAFWKELAEREQELLCRPAKRVRPALLILGYQLAQPGTSIPKAVHQFAHGLEILHTFMLIHDDVADNASVRRGGPTLHVALSSSPNEAKLGADLAVVAGDHLFAAAIETMLTCGSPVAAEATQKMLAVCRHTAIGQALDIKLGSVPFSQVTLFETVRVAHLKTARYGFVAPLMCGALLGGGSTQLQERLSRVGRHAGIAFQLKDDLLGLFGHDVVAGKSGAADYLEGKRTFPALAAWTRADAQGRAEIQALWSLSSKDASACERARAAVLRWGGKSATERLIERNTRAAMKALSLIPQGAARSQLSALLSRLQHRVA